MTERTINTLADAVCALQPVADALAEQVGTRKAKTLVRGSARHVVRLAGAIGKHVNMAAAILLAELFAE